MGSEAAEALVVVGQEAVVDLVAVAPRGAGDDTQLV